jgi:tetratricopeptide (TPR) repeat protein
MDRELNEQRLQSGLGLETGRGRTRILLLFGLVFLTLVVFYPVIGHQFLAYDDPVDVYKNPYIRVRSLDNLLHFWRYPYEGLYTPLVYTLYALTAWLPGLLAANATAAVIPAAWLFHSLNCLLHLLNALMVWQILHLLLRRTQPAVTAPDTASRSLPLEWAAWGGALLFAVHPIQVEAVAWVAGLKDVLHGFLALAAVWFYLQYTDAASEPVADATDSSRLNYGLASGAYILALLAKPTAVVIPLIVWVLASWGWQLSWRRQIRGLAAWILIAVAWVFLTRWIQPGSYLAFEPPLWTRPLIAGDAVLFYLYKLIWPLQFGPDYGRTPQYVLAHGWIYLTGLAPLALLTLLWLKRRRLSWLVTAAAIFVVGLLPVLGLISFAFQRYSTVADRYAYLAMLGPALALAGGLVRLRKKTAIVCGAVVLGLFLLRSILLVPYWHDTTTFFNHALEVNPHSFLAHSNLGFVLAEQRQDAQAIHHLNEALRIDPESAVTYLNLGNAMDRQGKNKEAIQYYGEALRIVPNYARAHTNLGLSLAKQGNYDEALKHHREALRIEPRFADAHLNLADVLARQGNLEAAEQHYTEAIRLAPGSVKAHSRYAVALAIQKRFDEANYHFAEALRLQPNSARAHANLAGVLVQQMKLPEAEQHYREAIRLDPQYKNAHLRLSTVLAAQGKFGGAKHHIREVLRMDPDNPAARQILERIEYLERSQ